MNKYELMYIIDVALDDEPRKELIERISKLVTDNGGEVEKTDEWGKRRLAYPINYKNEGYYVLVNFSAGSDLPREIERVLQINENVLRYLVIRLEEKHTSVKPRAIPVRPVYGRPPEPLPPMQDMEAPAPVEAPAQAEAPAQEVAQTVAVEATEPVSETAQTVANVETTVETEA